MAKIEKTFELNITHEILLLVERFKWILEVLNSNHNLKNERYSISTRKSIPYAEGLPINLEGKKDGGWDVKIVSPAISDRPARAIFLQFKSGIHKQYCQRKESKFYGSSKNINPFIEFEFAKNKQHQLLRDISNKTNAPNCVLYVFPRMSCIDGLKENLGSLLHKTTFISIQQMDEEAKQKGIDLDIASRHLFRVCYNDPYKYEANYYYYGIDGKYDFGSLAAELIAIRVMRTLDDLKHQLNEEYKDIPMKNLIISFKHLLNEIMHYARIYDKEILNDDDLLTRVRAIHHFDNLDQILEKDRNEYYIMRQNFVRKALTALEPYISLTYQGKFDKNTIIPEAPAWFTFPLKKELNFSLDKSYRESDFYNINYSIY